MGSLNLVGVQNETFEKFSILLLLFLKPEINTDK